MSTIIFSINQSLDGYCDHTIYHPADDVMEYFADFVEAIDLTLYGRLMYQLMFPYWAEAAASRKGTAAEIRFAERITVMDKLVLSQTLDSVGYNTKLVSGNAIDILADLRASPGKRISVDSISLFPEFLRAGLIDEVHLMIHPVMAGRGRLLLAPGSLSDNVYLHLKGTKVFASGSVAQMYKVEKK
jgi:dihydrofolate reductase